MARHLTGPEIEELAGSRKAKRIAVENFLGTMDPALSADTHRANMYMDADLYQWNSVTRIAILTGIAMAYEPAEVQ